MLDLFYSMVAGITQFLLAVLPDSPVSGWISSINLQVSSISTGLGWLNWLVDINGMKIIMGLWLVAVLAYLVARFGIKMSNSIKSIVGRFLGNLGGDGE